MLKRTFPLFEALTAAALIFACLVQNAAYVLPYPANHLVFPLETLVLLCLSAALLVHIAALRVPLNGRREWFFRGWLPLLGGMALLAAGQSAGRCSDRLPLPPLMGRALFLRLSIQNMVGSRRVASADPAGTVFVAALLPRPVPADGRAAVPDGIGGNASCLSFESSLSLWCTAGTIP